jgi:dipeptidyl aminopeptidase/acylaminoacyl peptidase
VSLGVGDRTLRELSWADNDQLLITTAKPVHDPGATASQRSEPIFEVFSVSANRLRPLVREGQKNLGFLLSMPESRIVDDRTVIFIQGVHVLNDRSLPALFSVDLDSGQINLVETGSINTKRWLVDQNGRVAAAGEYDKASRHWSLALWRNDHWIKVYDVAAPIESPRIEGFGPDGQSVILKSIKDDRVVIERLNLSDGGLATDSDFATFDSIPLLDRTSGRIIGREAIGARFSYTFLAKADQEAWDSVEARFVEEQVQLVSWSLDRKRVVVQVNGVRDGNEFELVDLSRSEVRDLGPANKDIGPADVADVKFLTYAASDGTEIPAFLTLPRGRTPTSLPLVLFVHGGPAQQDGPGFDWLAQALASRGYAVLQAEFRGSKGFGWAHLAAGFGEWGRKMQTDLSDGVRFLAAQGLIDAKRVCIIGASYGGYAALAGPTLDVGVYRCAISIAGISDLRYFLDFERIHARTSKTRAMQYWMRFLGVDSIDDPKLEKLSPLRHASETAAPILLVHGSADEVVPIAQSENMAEALRTVGKPVTFIKLDGEDHELSHPKTREEMLRAVVAFLQVNNPPD